MFLQVSLRAPILHWQRFELQRGTPPTPFTCPFDTATPSIIVENTVQLKKTCCCVNTVGRRGNRKAEIRAYFMVLLMFSEPTVEASETLSERSKVPLQVQVNRELANQDCTCLRTATHPTKESSSFSQTWRWRSFRKCTQAKFILAVLGLWRENNALLYILPIEVIISKLIFATWCIPLKTSDSNNYTAWFHKR